MTAGMDRGFTLVELMITLVVAALALALAVPTWRDVVEKRELTSAAEDIVTFIEFARTEAIKRNEKVSISWYSPGSHNVNWCIGASMAPKDLPCDCRVTTTTADDFCAIDSVEHRLVQADFVQIGGEFMHMNPESSSFAFDPVRGTVVDILDAESVDGDWLFYVHSNEGSGSTRLFELQVEVNPVGRATICASTSRKSLIGGYPTC